MRAIFNVSVGVEGQSHKTAGMETQISAAVKLIPRRRKKKKKKMSAGKRNRRYKKYLKKKKHQFSVPPAKYTERLHTLLSPVLIA